MSATPKHTSGKSVPVPGGRRGLQKASKSHAKVVASSESADVKKERKKRRCRPGTKALREIRKYQKSTDNLIPAAAIRRVIKDILDDLGHYDIRITKGAFGAMHQCVEDYLADNFALLADLANHRKAKTITIEDAMLARKIRPQKR